MTIGWGRTVALSAVAVIVFTASAHAQTDRGASNGLFGRGRLATEGQAQSDFAFSLFEAYDGDLSGDAATGLGDSRARLGPYSALAANLTFAKATKRFSLSARGDSTLAFYPALDDFVAGAARGSIAVEGPLGRRIGLRASQSSGYSPSYEITVSDAGDLAAQVAEGRQTFAQHAHFHETSAGIALALDRRSSVSLETSVRQFRMTESPAQSTLGMGARYQRQLTTYASARAGYGRRGMEVGGKSRGSAPTSHDLDVGVDYQRPLSVSKRTNFSFGSGSAVLASADGQRPWITGQAAVRRDIGRTWVAGAHFARQVQFLDGFSDPYASTSAGAMLGGMVGRRVDLQLTALHSIGTLGFGAGSRDLTTSVGSGRLRVALSRQLAIASEYIYFRSRTGGDVLALSALDRHPDRHRVKIGLTVWVPLPP